MSAPERHTQVCIGCGARSPEAETNYTLISSRFGWRLHRYKNESGGYVLEWYCPKCWSRRKGEPPSTPPAMGRR
jgi:hypothetical protein